ncbi:MAG TPA: hypothetical protein DDZ96_06140 [Porphyromonadaceae bacterium]|nr:hypothetical protein [Porphyromonadaceae bacterium]HBX45019.1 hypothetical protein [Porphyromonadaceae bacterium]
MMPDHAKRLRNCLNLFRCFKKNYFLGVFFLVLTIIAGYLSQIKGRRIQKRNFLKAKNFKYRLRKKFKQFLNLLEL